MPAYRSRSKVPRWPGFAAGWAVDRSQRVGAASACDVLNSYASQLAGGFEALDAQYTAAGVDTTADLFGKTWDDTISDWRLFYDDWNSATGGCNWTDDIVAESLGNSVSALRDELDAWNVTLRTWQERGQVQKGITPQVPAPSEAPALPESTGETVASTIKTVAIAAAVIVGGVVLWKVFDTIGD